MRHVLIGAVVLASLSIPANAEDAGYHHRDWNWAAKAFDEDRQTYRGNRYRYARQHRPRVEYVEPVRPRVYGWVSPGVTSFHAPHCAPDTVGIGQATIGADDALASAKIDWMQRVRFSFGELYVNLDAAQDVRSRCSRAEINEGLVGRTVEKMANAVGREDAFRKRCEIIARPCRVPLQPGMQAITPTSQTMPQSEAVPMVRELSR